MLLFLIVFCSTIGQCIMTVLELLMKRPAGQTYLQKDY